MLGIANSEVWSLYKTPAKESGGRQFSNDLAA